MCCVENAKTQSSLSFRLSLSQKRLSQNWVTMANTLANANL